MVSSAPGPVYQAISALPLPALPASVAKWVPGESPFSTNKEVVSALAVYLAVIFGGQYLMSDRKAFRFKPLFMLHNFLLSAGSGIVLALMVEEIVPIIYEHGIFYAICNDGAWTPRLETYYIINYFFKYWELADTVFLVVKKKPLQFLHVFHHTATAALCYTQLNGRTSVSWVPIVANLTVHVLMYYYYFMTAAGYKIWWKKYLTTLQITQFVIDLFVVYFASYSYFASTYFPYMPTYGTCSGTEGAAFMGCALLTSYLFLFIAFYKKTYAQQVAAKAAGAVKKAAATAEKVAIEAVEKSKAQ
ncbi:GNS1/SUR4 family-domain-containing protein [Leucosporidium creatinivorum]|uniref:Elongation of fatty acids protein n=1 Tax=Leucosporidium creatinivorum TaxID=106004 RepID=A0A1Y2FN04_9BASI|nr:GNS1/SUR4 family-domain-containing protein [Leucosporidium creatinivorum]